MKAFTHNIPIFNYFLLLLSVTKEDMESEDKISKLKEYLKPYFLESYIEEIIDIAKSGSEEAVTRTKDCSSFCIFYNLENCKTEIYGHEKRHVEDEILKICNINDTETAGYIAGYLSTVFEDFDNLNETTKYDYIDKDYNLKNKK